MRFYKGDRDRSHQLTALPTMRKIYGTLTVKVVIDLDDTYSDETIACLDFLDGFELIPAEGAIVIDSDITDFEITDSK